MRSVLLSLMVSVTQVQLSPWWPWRPCPPSCVVCTKDATICNKLSSIIEVPESTKALLLTDGLIDTVDATAFSHLSNMSVLVLSYNIISTITANAFHNLTILTTLLLDHNHISSQTLDRTTFSWMRNLEILHLGDNALREVHGSWFERSGALKALQLQGNFLTSLNSGTFASSDLRNLETLDLSDNLISHVDKQSFQELPRLRSLDLSRNRLKVAPDAFADLPQLSVLNLELNEWNCTCELVELASFLNSFVQSPGTVLNDGQGMVCARSDNPSVRTVLDLTAANCVPANSKISVKAVARRSIPPQRYTRDVALAAAFACLGGVWITLAVLAIAHRKLSKKCKSCQGKNGVEDQSSQGSVHWNFSEGKEALSMSCGLHNSHIAAHQPWDKVDSSFSTAPDLMENHVVCQNCGSDSLRPSSRREIVQHLKREDDWPDHTGGDIKVGGHQSRTKASRDEIFNGFGRSNTSRHENPRDSRGLSTIRMSELPLRRHGSASLRRTSPNKGQIHCNHVHHKFLKHEHLEDTPAIHQTLNCLHCHHAYEYKQIRSEDQDCLLRHHRNGTPPRSRVILYRNALNHTPSNIYWQGDGQTRVQRSVSFDLSIVPNRELDGLYGINRTKILRTLEQERVSKSAKTDRTDSHGHLKTPKHRSAGKRKLKVKFNLNPFKTTQVHPKPGGQEVVNVDKTSKTVKTHKPQKNKVKKKTESQSKAKPKPKKDKATKKSWQDEDPDLKQVPKSLKHESPRPEGGSDLIDESEDVAITQLLNINTTDAHQVLNLDSNLQPSTLKDTSIMKHQNTEDSVQLALGSNLVGERTEPLSLISSTYPQQAVNPTMDLSARTHHPTNASNPLMQSPGLFADLRQVTNQGLDLMVNMQSSQTFSNTSVPSTQTSDLTARGEEMPTTQPFNTRNTTDHQPRDANVDLNLPPSTLEDTSIMKHQGTEDSVQLALGSNLVAERTDMALTQPLSLISSTYPQQAVNPTVDLSARTRHPGLFADLRQVTNQRLDLPANVQSSQTFSNTSVPSTQTSDLTSRGEEMPFNPTDHQPQGANLDLKLPASTLDEVEPTKDSTTPLFLNHSVVQEYPSLGGVSPKRKIRLVVPEKASSRPQSALDKKIR